jgi:CheY-like chemotaxis protein
MVFNQHIRPVPVFKTSKLRILIADDHYANLLLTQSLLQREGYNVICAKNGLQAVNACKNIVFDIILLDIQMPVMDGIEALSQIKKLGNPNIECPIFALTAHSDASEIQSILALGFDAVLRKPFRVQEMMDSLQNLRTNKPHLTPALQVNQHSGPEIYEDTLRLPLLEVQTISILINATGPERMKKILIAFWKDADMLITSLKGTRFNMNIDAQPTLDELRKTAHGLKGAAANIGLLRASRLSALLQNAPLQHAPYLIEKIESTLHASKSEIDNYCSQHECNNTRKAQA